MKKNVREVTIEECGNGFPDPEDYVPGNDGNLYRVVSFCGRIQTGARSGAPNYLHATVQLVNWDDCDEGDVVSGRSVELHRVEPE